MFLLRLVSILILVSGPEFLLGANKNNYKKIIKRPDLLLHT